MTPLWLTEAADQFWTWAGEREGFPRRLERSVAFALPLTIIALPRLRLHAIDTWLAQQSVAASLHQGNRRLRGCLVAYGGSGLVFLDGTDPDDERRFSLAHEVAHFLLDYHLPRQAALARLGERIRPVLDGLRPPTQTERIDAVLSRTPLGLHLHLLERGAWGYAEGRVEEAERRADDLALELLAPADEALRRLTASGEALSVERAVALLTGDMGLPQAAAEVYARRLVGPSRPPLSFVRRIGAR